MLNHDKDHNIVVRRARVNNLKDVDVVVPRNTLTVITGLSGSGKSSLAFDTLYAEGQRRYVESLSAYARQFLGKMAKPEVDFIKGLPPAIAVEQKVNTRNPRSTVGTSTEIYDYLRLLFARIGRTFSPISDRQVKKHTVEDVIITAKSYPEGTRIAITAPIIVGHDRTVSDRLDSLLKQGYTRLYHDGTFDRIDDILQSGSHIDTDQYQMLIDRLAVAYEGDELSRLAESTEAAFFEGANRCTLVVWADDGIHTHDFSAQFEADGMTFTEPTDQMFNFNNPYGACPRCEGFGKTIGIDEALVIPNPALSVYDDAVACWRGEKMGQWKRQLIHIAASVGFPIHRPYCDLTDEQRHFLWHGDNRFEGIDGFFRMVEENQYKIQYRVMMARYRGKTVCPDCHGTRLRHDASYVRIDGKNITDLNAMPIDDLKQWFDSLQLTEHDEKIASRLLSEIRTRLTFLCDVGLGYLTLDRASNSLSGGESQRINLATSLGSSLVGSLYILDEPSIGLHPRDTHRLIGVLRHLQRIGNTVVVVEHDPDIMRAADYIIDVGPEAGTGGGEIVYQGPVDGIIGTPRSHTAQYLAEGLHSSSTQHTRRKWRDYIEVKGARHNNLKNIDVRFPLDVLTVVTGVSGSGKSTLVYDILAKAMMRHLEMATDAPGAHHSIAGSLQRIQAIEFVDQNPIGRSTRSNPATYLKAYDEIRALFADQQAARQMGFPPAWFSFNTEGGRCEACKGEGVINIEMQFMADIVIPCEECHGRRFKHDVLEVTYRGKNIYDVLEMTVDEAIDFFSQVDAPTERRIVRRLRPLQDVGLGYIRLGQSSSTLSGGENQRVKLAYFLATEGQRRTMFIFDEPTTGLHPHDIARLLDAFNRLIAQGHTIIVVEHNLDVIAAADHIIDIGPEGGDAGGQIVAEGTPEQIVALGRGYTAQYLELVP